MKKVISYILLLALLCILPIPARAEIVQPTHGFDTKELSEERVRNFWENIGLQLLGEEAELNVIKCFAVHPDGRIALGFEALDKKIIYVYDENGQFLYGYSFLSPGTFGFAWIGDDLAIYFGRGAYVLTVDRNGQYVECEEMLYTDNSNARINQVLYGSRLTVGGREYFLESDYGIVERSYSRLVVRQADGTEQILYDVTQTHNISTIFSYIFVALFVGAVIGILYLQAKKQAEEEKNTGETNGQ